MRLFFMGLLIGLSTASAGQVAAEDSQPTRSSWPPAAIAESRLTAKPMTTPQSLTYPQERLERFERSTPVSTNVQVDGWAKGVIVDDDNSPPTLVSPVIELPPRGTASPSAEDRAWEQIRQRERMRADARRARIAYRKAIGYSPARPTIRDSIVPRRVIYYPHYPFGIYGR